MRIVWVISKWPWPAQDGARVATSQLLRQLAQLGHVIDLIAVTGPEESPDPEKLRQELSLKSVQFVARHAFPASGMGRYMRFFRAFVIQPSSAVTLSPFRLSEVAQLITEATSQEGVDALVYDGLHAAAHSARRGKYEPVSRLPIIYRAHNVESDLWGRKAEMHAPGSPLRAFLRVQEKLMSRFETSLIRSASAIATVSPDDLLRFKHQTPNMNGSVVPIGADFSSPLPFKNLNDSSVLNLMFLGRLDWPPNRDGLAWFLREVWPEAQKRRVGLRLRIAGSGDGKWLAALAERLEGIEILGRIENLESFYATSDLALVPVFYGSGTRVKVIEASRFGRACLSSALGVEGTGLVPDTSYFRAESSDQWIERLIRLNHSDVQRVGQIAFGTLKERFDARNSAKSFEKLVETISSR